METQQSVAVAVALSNQTVLHIEATRLRAAELEQEVVDIDRLFSFDDIRESILGISSEVVRAFEQAKPQKASVEFGIEVCVEGGHLTAMIVKGSGKANLKITLEWNDISQVK